jgi:hypothetical protein
VVIRVQFEGATRYYNHCPYMNKKKQEGSKNIIRPTKPCSKARFQKIIELNHPRFGYQL